MYVCTLLPAQSSTPHSSYPQEKIPLNKKTEAIAMTSSLKVDRFRIEYSPLAHRIQFP